MTSDVAGMTPDVTRTIKNDSERKESVKTRSDKIHESVTRQIKDGFDRFGPSAGRKGKKSANAAYRAALKLLMRKSIAGMDRCEKRCVTNGRRLEHICHPTTWLQQGRWDDERRLSRTHPNRQQGLVAGNAGGV